MEQHNDVPAETQQRQVGYMRVSTKDQNLDRQRAVLDPICVKVFKDKRTGKNAKRPGLEECLKYLRPGDTLVVTELTRLGRSLLDLITILDGLMEKGIEFKTIENPIDTSKPEGRMIRNVLGSLAQYQREMIVELTHQGLEAAAAKGHYGGRPTRLDGEKVRQVRSLIAAGETVQQVADTFGVSRGVVYRALDEKWQERRPTSTRRAS